MWTSCCLVLQTGGPIYSSKHPACTSNRQSYCKWWRLSALSWKFRGQSRGRSRCAHVWGSRSTGQLRPRPLHAGNPTGKTVWSACTGIASGGRGGEFFVKMKSCHSTCAFVNLPFVTGMLHYVLALCPYKHHHTKSALVQSVLANHRAALLSSKRATFHKPNF